MSPRYLLYMPAPEIKKHIRLYDDLSTDSSDFIWEIEHTSDANTRSVTICAQDRPGLISKIAGVFTLNNIDILDVQVFTWRNNIALDIFKVKTAAGSSAGRRKMGPDRDGPWGRIDRRTGPDRSP